MQTAVQAFRLETSLTESGTLTLDDLPFQAGDRVEVIVLTQPLDRATESSYSLRGMPIKYDKPFDSVAEEDWAAAQ